MLMGSKYMKTIMKLAQIYLSMHLVNVKNGSHKVIKAARHVDTITRELYDTDFEDHMMHIMNILCVDKYKDSVFDFIKLDTLQERMDGKDTIAHEFVGSISGWCRERFIKVDEDAEGKLCHVLYCVEVIDEEKRRENDVVMRLGGDEFALYILGLFEKKQADTAMYTSKKTEGCCATIYQYDEI